MWDLTYLYKIIEKNFIFFVVKSEELTSFTVSHFEEQNNGKLICINLDDVSSGNLKSQKERKDGHFPLFLSVEIRLLRLINVQFSPLWRMLRGWWMLSYKSLKSSETRKAQLNWTELQQNTTNTTNSNSEKH